MLSVLDCSLLPCFEIFIISLPSNHMQTKSGCLSFHREDEDSIGACDNYFAVFNILYLKKSVCLNSVVTQMHQCNFQCNVTGTL
jgi:hypothetical protein